MILLLLYTVMFFLISILLFKESTLINNKFTRKILEIGLILITFYMLIIVDSNYADRVVYSRIFREFKHLSLGEIFGSYSQEPLFMIITKLISMLTDDEMIYYTMIYLIFLITLFKGLKMIFMNKYHIYAFIVFVNFGIYYGYVLNGLRQGLAMSLIILTIGYALKRKPIKMIIVSFSAILFHYSSIPIVIFVIILSYFRNFKIKYFIIIYIVFFLLYITGFNQYLFSSIKISSLDEYSNRDLIDRFGGSNKINFIIFNTFYLVIFSIFLKKNRKNEVFLFLYKSYILFSVYFMAFGFIAYSNRLSAYSWFLIPIITGYIMVNSSSKLLVLLIALFVFILGYIFGIHFYYLDYY